jgi:hypothetical protein
MTFEEAYKNIDQAKQRLKHLWHEAYDQAKTEIGGSCQDEATWKLWRRRATEIVDASLADTQIRVVWGPAPKRKENGTQGTSGSNKE